MLKGSGRKVDQRKLLLFQILTKMKKSIQMFRYIKNYVIVSKKGEIEKGFDLFLCVPMLLFEAIQEFGLKR